jgi:hypothetical protein
MGYLFRPSLTRPFRITTYKDCGIRGNPKTHALSFGGSKRETHVTPLSSITPLQQTNIFDLNEEEPNVQILKVHYENI